MHCCCNLSVEGMFNHQNIFVKCMHHHLKRVDLAVNNWDLHDAQGRNVVIMSVLSHAAQGYLLENEIKTATQ